MPIKKIDASTLKKWMDTGEAVVLDVREPAEHRSQKIQGSHNISHAMVTKDKLPFEEGKKLVLHCHSGRRSTVACENLLKSNPELELYELEGGITSWVANSYNTESTGKSIIPVDRQVQVTIGFLIILFSLLTFFVNKSFVFFVLAFGCGLLFAGLSGTCMLALLLAKMPWNQ